MAASAVVKARDAVASALELALTESDLGAFWSLSAERALAYAHLQRARVAGDVGALRSR